MKNIKSLFLAMLLASSTLNFTVHTPAAGPLTLSDTVDSKGTITATGIVTATYPHSADLTQERIIINNFKNTFSGHKTYQRIIEEIKSSHTDLSDQALEAIERVIMNIYHQKAFIYNPGKTPIGVRYSWLNPTSYFNPKAWVGDNNKQLDQLLTELDQLATIAMDKKPFIGTRMKATVHSYRHWRKYTLLTAAAGATAIAIHKDNIKNLSKSFLKLISNKKHLMGYKFTFSQPAEQKTFSKRVFSGASNWRFSESNGFSTDDEFVLKRLLSGYNNWRFKTLDN